MKFIYISVWLLFIAQLSFSQTNVFPSSGNVGIGTTSPSRSFQVANQNGVHSLLGGTYFWGTSTGSGYDNNGISTGGFYNGSTLTITNSEYACYQQVGGSHYYYGATGLTPGISSTAPILMRINGSNGNVGIGTADPSAMLDISATTGGPSMLRVKGYSDAYTPFLLNLGTQSYQDNFQVKMVNGFTTLGNTLNHALGLTTNNIERVRIDNSGNVGIGTTSPDSKLTVAGDIHSREVKVTATAGADFVFEEDYKLRSLVETEKFIKDNKHLPEIASADEMKNNGIQLGEMNIKLLQKIEELTLYLIEQNKEIKEQRTMIKNLQEIIQPKIKP